MRKMLVFLIGTLMLLTIPTIVRAVTCDECWDFYEGLKYNGYSDEDCKKGAIMWNSGCRECFYGSASDSGSSSTDGGGSCCGASGMILFALCGIFIVYYGKKRNMKK